MNHSITRKTLIHLAGALLLVWTLLPIAWTVVVSITYHAEFAGSQTGSMPFCWNRFATC